MYQDADESLAIDNELLCEIEAESWVNGTRGILVESRAPALPTLEQNSSLLPGRPNDRSAKAAKAAATAALNAEEGALYSMPWQKLQVRLEKDNDLFVAVLGPALVVVVLWFPMVLCTSNLLSEHLGIREPETTER